jgi:phage repressor protein C with HTH and peptisase S24 domain
MHQDLWKAIDALAARRGATPSGLAKQAGLDPTTFNPSKRVGKDGRPRWPSTESLFRALEAAGADLGEFADLLSGSGSGSRAIPIVGAARAGADGYFDEQGFPVGAEDTVHFPGNEEGRLYALEINGDSMEPLYRAGDLVIVQAGAAVRRGDRVVVRMKSGEVLAKILARKTDSALELTSVNPAYSAREVARADVDWMARIVWASQ